MPKIHNPKAYDLFCAIKGDIIKAGDSVDATVEEAKAAARSGIFKVIDEAEAVEKAVTGRASAKRATKAVETAAAAAPEVEVR